MSIEPQGPLNPLDPRLGWINAPVHVHELRGHPTLYVFWNRHEKDARARWRDLIEALAPRVAKGLSVLGIHVPIVAEDLDSQVLERFVRDAGIPYPIAIDDGRERDSIAIAHEVTELPTFLLFDAKGDLSMSVVRPRDTQALSQALEGPLDAMIGAPEGAVMH